MEFFDYKPTSTANLKTGRTRFSAVVFMNPLGGAPGCDLWRQEVTRYEDGREIVDDRGKVSLTLADPAMLSTSFTLYHPVTGDTIGSMTYGELAGVVYSAAISINEQYEASLAPENP